MTESTKKAKKRKWKEVSIDNSAFFSGNLEGFVSLEECVDYTLDSDESSRVFKFNEGTQEKKPKKDSEQSKKKKKRKKKKRKNIETDKAAENEDLEQDKVEKYDKQNNEGNFIHTRTIGRKK